jgi:hypothetical protein
MKRLSPAFGNKREGFWMANGGDRKVNVQFGPIQVIRRRPFDGVDLGDGRMSKPRKLRKRQQQFFVPSNNQNPCWETWVTSGAEMTVPGIGDLSKMGFDDHLGIG